MSKTTGAAPDMRREYKKELHVLELQIKTHRRDTEKGVAASIKETRKLRASAKRFQRACHIVCERKVAALQRQALQTQKANEKAIAKLGNRQAILLGRLS